jgi:hypothetical protein
MRLLDRREVLKLGGASALAAIAPSWPALATPGKCAPALVLADLRYSDSLAFARGAGRQGAEIVPLARNLAEIWFGTVKPRLPGLQVLAGLTLDSDLFALERLAEDSGAGTVYTGAHDWRYGRHSAHHLGGALPLARLSASLVGGEATLWAERLGSALVETNWMGMERTEPRQRAELRLKQFPAANGPLYFVSWLLRWTRTDIG